MKKWVLLPLFMVALYIWYVPSPASTLLTEDVLPASELRAYMAAQVDPKAHPCLNRRYCLVVYLSPWCPSCNRTQHFVPVIRQVLKDIPSAGLMVVVGKGWRNFEQGYVMAETIGGEVYLDPDAQYYQQIKESVSGVPAWMVFDSSGSLVKSRLGSPQRHDRQMAGLFLRELGLFPE